MATEFRMIHRVEFADTDMAGLIHFSSYFRYMEVTEHAFFRSLGLSVAAGGVEHRIGWPRVHVECDYKGPLVFEDEVEVHLRVRARGEKSITYDFGFRRVRPEPALDVGRGSMTAVCVARDANGTMKAVPIPEPVARKIEAAPVEGARE
jgi:YbgC/YbaW family acyl-CoA thioester hydrolase